MKKVLIISYYWPPSGTISVHRCLKFAKYLKDFGWEPVVYTAKNAHYPYLDDSNLKEAEGIRVIKGKIIEPFALFKLISGRKKDTPLNNILHVRDKKKNFIDKFAIWVRSNFFIPDARMLWIRPSVRLLSKYIKNENFDAIISTGPPHSSNYIAYKLKNKFNLPWIADFQDPWTQVDYYQLLNLSKRARKKHERMELEVLQNSDLNTIVSPTWKIDLEKIGSKKTEVIYLGYDEDDFPKEKEEPYREFTISHAGLLGFDRKPTVIFKVLRDLSDEIEGFKQNFKLRFAGSIDYDVIKEIEEYNLADNFLNLGTISRNEALKLTLKSHILLLPLNKADNVKGRVPGKLFEQMQSNVPILCLGPGGTDVSKIISDSNTGVSFNYDDYKGVKCFILDAFKSFKDKKAHHENKNISEYSVKNQVKKLAGYLDNIKNNF